jgi:hypothetical protein
MNPAVVKLTVLLENAGLPGDNIIAKALDGDTDALHELVNKCCTQNHDAFVQDVHTLAQKHILKSGSLMHCADAVAEFAPGSRLDFQREVKRLASSMILGDQPDFERIKSLMNQSGKSADVEAFTNIVLHASAQQEVLKHLLNPGDLDVSTLTYDKPQTQHTMKSLAALVRIFPLLFPDEKDILRTLKKELVSRSAVDRAAKAESELSQCKQVLETQKRKIMDQDTLLHRMSAMMEEMEKRINALQGNAGASNGAAGADDDETNVGDSPILSAVSTGTPVLPPVTVSQGDAGGDDDNTNAGESPILRAAPISTVAPPAPVQLQSAASATNKRSRGGGDGASKNAKQRMGSAKAVDEKLAYPGDDVQTQMFD